MPPDTLIFGGLVMEMGGGATATPRLYAFSKLYLTFTATHPIDGSLTFYIGDQYFSSNNAPTGGHPVHPAVTSWGDLRQFMAEDGQDRGGGGFAITMSALKAVIPSNGIKEYPLYRLLRELQGLPDAPVSIYSWDALTSTQTLIVTGYWRNLDRMSIPVGGVPILSVSIALRPSTMDRNIGKLIQTTSPYPPSLPDAVGIMISRAYGDFTLAPLASLGTAMSASVFGYGGRFVPGVVVRET